MAFNVWFVIWPNQKKALGIVAADDAEKAKAARAGDDGLADQPDAVDPDALLHGHGRAPADVRIRTRVRAPAKPGPAHPPGGPGP